MTQVFTARYGIKLHENSYIIYLNFFLTNFIVENNSAVIYCLKFFSLCKAKNIYIRI